MRIVVVDGYTLNPGDNPWDPIAQLGELTVFDRTLPEQLIERASPAEILVVNKLPIRDADLRKLRSCKFIAISATGFDMVDISAAKSLGISVSNVPEYGTGSVAQFTFALLLELCSHVGLHASSVRNGEWSTCPDFCYWKQPLVELSGLRMGIVGFGRIGRRVAEIAHAIGMSVAAYDLMRTPVPVSLDFVWQEIEHLFAQADVVSLHCPLSAETERLVNEDTINLMKRTAFLINTSRGRLVNEGALARALNEGRIAGAALDVVSTEPIDQNNPLLGARNCIITPHIAWASQAARRRLMTATAENIAAFFRGQPVNVVNR